jgi:hypothetical protein
MFPCEMTASLRECGLAYAGLGNHRKALKFLQNSCQSAERYNERYELAISQLELAKLRHRMGIPGAEREWRDAEDTMEPFRQVIRSSCDD